MSFEIGQGAVARVQTRWEAYESATLARKEIEADADYEPCDLSSDEYEVAGYGFGAWVQYMLWDELQKMYPLSPDTESEGEHSAVNTFPLGSFDFDIFTGFQRGPDEWNDTVAITQNETAFKKFRIMERAKLIPVVFEGEFKVSEDAFECAGNISPKTIGVRKIRITERKRLKPQTLPGEFEGLDQE